MARMDADGLLAGLDDGQRAAVTSPAAPLGILAGAGSGKTRVLTRRIAHRALSGDADPRKVLALTFTRKAAGELGDRLTKLGMRDRPTAGTFHAIAYAQLRTAWAGSGERAPVLLDRKGSFLGRLLGRARGLTVVDLAAEIEWAKARLVRPESYANAAGSAGRRSSADLERIADLYRRYEDEKRTRGVVDFDDLLIRCLAAMTRDDAFAAAQRWRFQHLFVDEFQDVNPLQFRLLRAWLGDSSDVCVVGDPAQAIYRWNGADADYLLRFEAHFPGAEVLELRSNYRSTPEILGVGARVLGNAAGIQRAPVQAMRPEGRSPTVEAFASDADEAAGVARDVRDHHGPGRSWSSQAVLVRTNGQLPVIEQAFRKANIPYRVRGGQAFAQRPEVRDALGAAGRASGAFSVWLADLEAAVAATRTQLASVNQSSDFGGDGALVADAAGAPSAPGSAADRVVGLEQLVRLGHEFAAIDPTAPVHAFGQWLTATVRGEDAGRGDAVQLATFHAAKGLEWPIVHLAGVEQGFVPIAHATDGDAVAEERRLVYVAVTRAEDELHVTWAKERTFGTRAVQRQPSPWLTLLASESAAAVRTGSGARGGGSTSGASPSRTRQALRESRRQLDEAIDHRPSRTRTADTDPQRRQAFDALWAWRADQARKASVPPAVVLSDRVLDALARARPTTHGELAATAGIGSLRAAQLGDTLLAVLADAAQPEDER